MKTYTPILLLATLALLAGCATTPDGPPPVTHADGTDTMPVAGVNGWQFNRVLRFGDFSTSPVGPTVTRTQTRCVGSCGFKTDLGLYYNEFDANYKTATSKIAFTQHGPAGLEAQVLAVNESRTQSAAWLTKWFGFATSAGGRHDVSTRFTGTVTPSAEGHPTWRFALISDIGQPDIDVPTGWFADDEGHVIVVRHMLPPAGTPAFVVNALHCAGPGLQFELDGRIVGAVDTLGGGLVRLRDDLPAETRFALAGLSTALLLRPRGG
jgi:hypothetical protein